MKQMRAERRHGAAAVQRRAGLYGALLLGTVGWAARAAADEPPSKASCAQAYESAQESRAAGQLEETRARLAFCAQPECPAFVQRDCARWLGEVEKELPSVVVSIAGVTPEAAAGVSVTLDGKAISTALGKPIQLDPGRHELALAQPGRAARTRIIMAQQGVQNRAVLLDLGAPTEPLGVPDAAHDEQRGNSTLRSLAYAGWGVGLVGLGTFAVLGTLGRADERSVRDDCPLATDTEGATTQGVCLESQVKERKSSYQREYVIADVGLYTGIAAAVAGTAAFLFSLGESGTQGTAKASQPRLDFALSPTPGGAWANVSGRF
jgi:hypothetical protein